MAIAALVVGIAAFCVSLVPILGLLAAVVAVILGAVSMKQIDRDPMLTGKGLAIAGLVIGIIVGVWALVYTVLFFLGIADFLDELEDLENAVVLIGLLAR